MTTTTLSPRTINWGILATGGIAQTFAKDISIPPSTRNVSDLTHHVVAAASSSSASRAQQFLRDVDAPKEAKAYGGGGEGGDGEGGKRGAYEQLVQDEAVEVIYVATPHSHHYQNVRLCLEGGKNVLCEKPLTVNAKQARILYDLAKEKNLFLMEAVWTRYFPLSIYIRELITSGTLGEVHRVSADNSSASSPETTYADGKSRMVNMDLAGGALLDLGIYSLTWLFQTLYLTQPLSLRQKPTVVSAMKSFKTGADAHTTMLLTFPRPKEVGGDAHGIASTSFYIATDPDKRQSAGPSIRIQGTKGEAQVFGPAFRPTRTRLVLADGKVEDKEWVQPGPGKGSGWFNGFGGQTQSEGEGQGMFWEADEVGKCLIRGVKESEVMTHQESVEIMEVMDEVRRQGKMGYPEGIESCEYPLKLD